MQQVPVSPKWRDALEMLADAGESGSAESELMALGFSAEMLKSLVRIGLATPTMRRVRIEENPAPRMRITDAGRRMLNPPR
jgi:hypothetical protein